jgi:UPF0755 protein
MYSNIEEDNNKLISENPVDNQVELVAASSPLRTFLVWFSLSVSLLLILNFSYHFLISPPKNFPIEQPIEITLGTSVVDIAKQLKDVGVVRSEFILYAVLVAYYEPTDIKASTYIFSNPLSVYEVASALTEGNYTYDLVRFTHREGMSVRAMSSDVTRVFPHISAGEFIAYATPFEGELFPETYFVPKDITLEALVALMRKAYQSTIALFANETIEHILSPTEIVILASILEREANSPETMKEVANILLRRLSINMPLQVDATMEYVIDKPLSELTAEDLREDSPYNTYTRSGLPPTPIGNPGTEALSAVIHATTNTPYLFYITGNDGVFYYARDFDEHRQNIQRYLR